MRFSVYVLAVALLGVAQPSLAQEEMVRTEQTARIDGRVLHYTAQVGRLPIRPMDSDEPHAYMSYTAYRMPSEDGSPRPLMFAWGGGPSGPALGIHMTYGPKRVEDGRLVDNDNTLLPVTDLVFVDPVGTGFSRPTMPEYGEEFYNVRGDAASVAEFIRVFRARYDPDNSPVLLRGGSYGVWRASFVAELLERSGTRVTGLSLRSGGIQFGPDALPESVVQALRTPGRAAAALSHGKLPPQVGVTLEEVLHNSEEWAMNVYAPALEEIDGLSGPERDSIASQLSMYTGYPGSKIDRATLVITPRDYLNDGLIEGERLDAYDMRVVVGGRERAGGEAGIPGNVDRDALRTAAYFRVDLGFRTDLAYLGGLEQGYMPTPGPAYRPPGSQWVYNTGAIGAAEPGSPEFQRLIAIAQSGEGPPGTEAWLLRALRIDPDIKVDVHAGLYDSLNSCAANEELMRRFPEFADNFHLRCFLAGHSLQIDPQVGGLAGDDLREWIAEIMGRFGG